MDQEKVTTDFHKFSLVFYSLMFSEHQAFLSVDVLQKIKCIYYLL